MAKHPFVSDRDAFEALGERTVRMLGAYLRDLPDEPVDRVVPKDVRLQNVDLSIELENLSFHLGQGPR